jgi:uncharacterized protein (TIGR00255 family)
MKSMTGYGSTKMNVRGGEVSIEIKAVNHRFLDTQIRLPYEFLEMEDKIRKQIKEQVFRGKVDVTVQVEEKTNKKRVLTIDEQLLDQYVAASNMINEKLRQETKLDISALLLDENIAQVEEASNQSWHFEEKSILKGLADALSSFNKMREEEGWYLQQDMKNWLHKLQHCCDEIEKLIPPVIKRYHEKLSQRIRSFINEEIEIDESRLLTEVAIFTEKMDVSEELVRLRAHCNQYTKYLLVEDEAIGRRLDFLVQEMNREVNTIGSKAPDTLIRQFVVEMKGYLEKLKEQVQNVE